MNIEKTHTVERWHGFSRQYIKQDTVVPRGFRHEKPVVSSNFSEMAKCNVLGSAVDFEMRRCNVKEDLSKELDFKILPVHLKSNHLN